MEAYAPGPELALDRSPIAIVGISGRFPGAASVEALWEMLAEGRHGLGEVPLDRWDAAARAEAEARPGEPPIGRWIGAIEEIDRFDAAFFNISAREARSMDPQQRLLLEEAWRAIEDAGVSLRALRRGRSSVYAGVMANDHQQLASRPGAAVDSFACLGSYACVLANRLSYLLDLDGPSAAVEAACASSLIALQLAAQDIRRGACEFGIAAGVSLNLDPWKHVSFSKSRMLSPTGACLPFDVAADGYVPGDGVVVVLLERLDLALQRGHHIHGVLRGVAVRHSGRTPSITAPSVAAQRAVLREALADAGVAPETVTYLEAHGTGTSLGDPIEVEALTQVYGGAGRGPVALGSVKANLGHLEAAAGLAGVARVLQMMRHRQIPPQARLKTLNPLIELEHTPLTVARTLTPWEPPPGTPRRASVSSFGFGGAVSHAIIEEAPAPAQAHSDAGGPFVLSARSGEGLAKLITAWRAFSETPAFLASPLGDLLGTLATGREAMPHRVGLLVRSHEELRAWLRDLTPSPPAERKESAWVLGELGWSGELPAPGDGASERTRRLYAAQTNDPTGRLAALTALSALLDAGASPACVVGHGPGHDLALVLTGALDPAGLDQPDAPLGRPDRPLWDPTRRALLATRVAPPGYLGGLLSGLMSAEVTPEQAGDEARRALLLAQGQATFRGTLAERAAALREGGVDLDALLSRLAESSAEGAAEVSPELRALAFIACRASARRVRARWGLTERSTALTPALEELIELVVDDVLPSDALVSLLLRGEERNRVVNERLGRLRPGAVMPRLDAWNARLQEHNDGGAWRRAARAAAAPIEGALGARGCGGWSGWIPRPSISSRWSFGAPESCTTGASGSPRARSARRRCRLDPLRGSGSA
ncbi:MAG: hypothetical protein IPN01_35730 [Deltaproteobacteria bacterium]|nr:hypothetical protein [Deltaproteobacteria bacterium]